MKVLVTGARGQLGHDLLEALDGHEVTGVDIEDFDVTDYGAVCRAVIGSGTGAGAGTGARARPDVVIHCAAYTDVDGCESNIETAYKVNAVGPQNLAIACNEAGSAMVYISTDFVFDGRKTEPYLEFDPVGPLSAYGKTKLAGELLVRELCPRHYIVRTSWLFGRQGKNFVRTMLELADTRKELAVVNDQVGSPTYSYDLARQIVRLVETGWFGAYHATNGGSCSWYEFAVRILELGGKKTPVRPITSDKLVRPAVRPAYSVLRNFFLELRGIDQMRPWEQALEHYFGCDSASQAP